MRKYRARSTKITGNNGGKIQDARSDLVIIARFYTSAIPATMRTVSAKTTRNTNPCYYETLLVVERYRGSRGTRNHSFRFKEEGIAAASAKKKVKFSCREERIWVSPGKYFRDV